MPEWAQLRGDIFAARDALVRRVRAHRDWLESRRSALPLVPGERVLDNARATEAADRRFQSELDATVAELNANVARHNLLVGTALLQLTALTVERLSQLADEEPSA